MRNRVEANVHARVGLLGNPGDGYGGRAIAFSLGNFSARVHVESGEGCSIESPGGVVAEFAGLAEMVRPIATREGADGERLIRAATRRFAQRFPEHVEGSGNDKRRGLRIGFESDIPREVGLSGSSAIVIACVRALLDFFGEAVSNDELAAMALAAEVEELGLAAGPMDRIIQAHEGCMWMDFAGMSRGKEPVHRQLDVALLPKMFVAWDPRGGQASSIVHSDVRARYERGDADVRRAMEVFPQLVDEGIAKLEANDHIGFAACVDRNFDTRASIWRLLPRDLELVAIGRERGCGVKQTGSGGAVVGVLNGGASFDEIVRDYEAAGYRAVRPQYVPANSNDANQKEA